MEINSFKNVDRFNFSDNYDIVKGKIEGEFVEDFLEVIDKKYPRIYIENLDLMINFEEDSMSVRFFELFNEEKKITLEGSNLILNDYSTIEKKIKEKDLNVTINESGLESEFMGIVITRIMDEENYSNKVESFLIGNKSYFSEEDIDLDDLYKSIMGEDYPS